MNHGNNRFQNEYDCEVGGPHIVDTAGGLASHLGPKYTTALKKRNTQLPEVFDNIFFN